MKVLLTGGGTGGHTTPLQAVAEELKNENNVSLVVIAEKKHNSTPPVRRVKTYYIPAGKLRRYHTRGLRQLLDLQTLKDNFIDMFKVIRGIGAAFRVIGKEKPDIVFIKGGYVSLPVGVAAWVRGVPYVTHDSDVLPGLTNRILAKGATRSLTGFPEKYYKYDKEKALHTGIPIRREFIDLTKAQARRKLKIPTHQKRVLIMGGSLGAQRVNEAVMRISSQLSQIAHITHITGHTTFEYVKNELAEQEVNSKKYEIYDYISNGVSLHLAAADVIVTRAGATSLAELAALKKPVIIIPNPLLAEGHQLKNAQVINTYDAGLIVHESEIQHDPYILLAKIDHLLNDGKQRKWLGENLQKLFPADATTSVVQQLKQLTKGS